MELPAAIIFINNDLNSVLSNKISTQLFLDQIMDGYVFDGYVASDAYYASNLLLNNKRVLVKRSFNDTTNRNLASVVIFVKSGLASILKNNFGPPGLTLPVQNFYIYQLLRDVGKIT